MRERRTSGFRAVSMDLTMKEAATLKISKGALK